MINITSIIFYQELALMCYNKISSCINYFPNIIIKPLSILNEPFKINHFKNHPKVQDALPDESS